MSCEVLQIARGDNRTFSLNVTNPDGTAVDLATVKLWVTFKRNAEDAVLFDKRNTLAGGDGTQVEMSLTLGLALIHLVHADTTSMPAGRLWFDVWAQGAADLEPYQITAPGALVITEAIKRIFP